MFELQGQEEGALLKAGGVVETRTRSGSPLHSGKRACACVCAWEVEVDLEFLPSPALPW